MKTVFIAAGYKLVELSTEQSLLAEGRAVGHSLAQLFSKMHGDPDSIYYGCRFFSVRDNLDTPLATAAVKNCQLVRLFEKAWWPLPAALREAVLQSAQTGLLPLDLSSAGAGAAASGPRMVESSHDIASLDAMIDPVGQWKDLDRLDHGIAILNNCDENAVNSGSGGPAEPWTSMVM